MSAPSQPGSSSPRETYLNLGPFRQSELFSSLDTSAIQDISGLFRAKEFSEGEYLFHQEQPAEIFHLVASGRVKVVQTSAEGLEVILHIFEPGGIIGALPTIGEGNYPASAVAMESVLTYSISSRDFQQVTEDYPQVSAKLLKFASQMLQTAHNRLREMATERVERRIARTLTRLLRQLGEEHDGEIILESPLTRQDLAELSGTTLFTISRTLKEWERRGLIRAERERVIILEPHELVVIAEDLPR